MIWVIGANGMLGSELCKQLETNTIPFVASDKDVDITNSANIETFIREQESSSYLSSSREAHHNSKISWIVNCAGLSSISFAESNTLDAEKLNILGPQNLCHIARYNNIKLIHISSDYVFDGTNTIPYTEESRKNPLTTYGKTKSLGEDEIIKGMTQYFILRTSLLYGYDHPNYIYKVADLMKNNQTVPADPSRIINPTSVQDLAETIITLIEKTDRNNVSFNAKDIIPFGIYNYTDNGQCSMLELTEKIYSLLKKYKHLSKQSQIQIIENVSDNKLQPACTSLSNEKISKELKIKIPTWEKSLEKFIKSKSFII